MKIVILLDQLAKLAPKAHPQYRVILPSMQGALDRFEISSKPLRTCHFMAQILHETSGFTVQTENLDLPAERIALLWPYRFQPKGRLNPADFVGNEKKLANSVYGGRMGNSGPDDGYIYRGRGLLQWRGKDRYAEVTTILRRYYPNVPDFVVNHDALLGHEWCIKAAAATWFDLGCNAIADTDSIRAVTSQLTGGDAGMAEREAWLKKTKAIWT
ncbi:MAG: lytic enzyme [Burkholderiales bacterium]|nr:lytic enzyme [Burkholderiales bacterium]